MNTHATETKKPRYIGVMALTLGALGVVFGDIGTSPLYAINEIFFGHALKTFTPSDVLGAISLVFWALTLIIAFKYVFFVMRADNEGEGGVFALFSQIRLLKKPPVWLLGLLLFGAGLLYGDGIITPAISVVSAVEGLKIITASFSPFVVPITIAILTVLFSIQSKGTALVGKIFGPVMLVWFASIGSIGFLSLIREPSILGALSPFHALSFLTSHELHTILLVLGSVMLVITGGEAMFADMGHFGAFPIRLGWYTIAYPALILNYLGQGAYLLSGQHVAYGNVFFSMVPPLLLPPMVILATMATVIASQAMISGAFSLTKQAISLRLLPYLPITYTHEEHEGQIYLPHINWALYAGSVLLVLIFQSSSRLAAAYGLAVAGDMTITTMSMIVIALSLWKWPRFAVFGLFMPFLFFDLSFLTANMLKFLSGGFIPATIGVAIFGIIEVWKWGRKHTINTFNSMKTMTVEEMVTIQKSTPNDLPRTMVFLTRTPIEKISDHIPIQLQRYWNRNQKLPEHLVLLNVELLKIPHAPKRFTVNHFTERNEPMGTVTSLTVYFGFMENPDLEPLVRSFIKHNDVPSTHPPKYWVFKVLHERIMLCPKCPKWAIIPYRIYEFIHRNTKKSDEFFGLGDDHMLTIDVCPVELS